MRTIIRSTSQLSDLRSALRHDVVRPGDADHVVDGFLSAVNEVVVAAIGAVDSAAAAGVGRDPGAAIDVRWIRRSFPRRELFAEVRSTMGALPSMADAEISSRILTASADRVDIEERIGGSLITVRCRV